MISYRTTARGFLFLAAILGFAVGISTAYARTATAPGHIIFPVVGDVQYQDDFGAPRPGGPHQGNDLIAVKQSPAVAAEAGRAKYWTTSATADRLTLKVSTSQAWPSGLTLTKLNQSISLAVPASALVQSTDSSGFLHAIANIAVATKGQKALVWTQPARASLKAERADDAALSAGLIQLTG